MLIIIQSFRSTWSDLHRDFRSWNVGHQGKKPGQDRSLTTICVYRHSGNDVVSDNLPSLWPVIRRGELIQTIHRGYGRSSHRIMEVLNNE